MAFSLNAFSGGLGGLLQQMIAGQQQNQAMQQKMVDQQIPLFNQQRAWQKEAADAAYEAEKRRNDLEMMPLLKQIQQAQLTGQTIGNNTAQTNLGILQASAPALSAAPGLQNQVTNNTITAGTQANDVAQAVGAEQKRTAGLAPKKEVLATEDKLREEIDAKTAILSANMAIMASRSATPDQKRAAQAVILATRQSLATLQAGLTKRYVAAGADPLEALGGISMFPQNLMTAPLPKITISPFSPVIKAVNADISKGLTEGVRTGDYKGGQYTVNGSFNAAKATMPTLDIPAVINRQLDGNAITRMFGTLEQNEADPVEYFKAYHGITLSPHEAAVKRLTPQNKAKLVQSFARTFVEPTAIANEAKDNYTNLFNTIADYFKTTTSAGTAAKGQVDAEKQKVIAGAIAAMQEGYTAQTKLALSNMRTASQQLSELEKSIMTMTGRSAGDILRVVDQVNSGYDDNVKAMVKAYQRALNAKQEMDDEYSKAFTFVPQEVNGKLSNNFAGLTKGLQAGNAKFNQFKNMFTGYTLDPTKPGIPQAPNNPAKKGGKATPQSSSSGETGGTAAAGGIHFGSD